MSTVQIGLIGDYNPAVVAHQAIPEALRLAAESVGCTVEATWIETAQLGPDVPAQLAGLTALWCVPASPYANTEGALAAIRFARESGRPFLGTCGGFQHALLEYVRDVLGYVQAEHTETQPDAGMPLIAPLTCSLVGKTGRIVFAENSRLRAIYGVAEAEEAYHCNYGLNPDYETLLDKSAMFVSGRDEEGQVRAVELTDHPFFLGTLFQPERTALHGRIHPLIRAYVAAACQTPAE